jgi:hypothetical protein
VPNKRSARGTSFAVKSPRRLRRRPATRTRRLTRPTPPPRSCRPNGFLQGYNAQAVANEDQVVVSAEVTDEQNDRAQLHPMIDATNESLEKAGIGDRPATLLADAGYASEENFAALDADDPDSYVAVCNMKKNPTRYTGWRGPLKKDATLIDRMDRKVSNKVGRDLYKRR